MTTKSETNDHISSETKTEPKDLIDSKKPIDSSEVDSHKRQKKV